MKKSTRKATVYTLQSAIEIGEAVYQPGGRCLIVFRLVKLGLQLLK